jgi:glycosyltransferase A (GT-A) superfamily protein (DUF2064 family)
MSVSRSVDRSVRNIPEAGTGDDQRDEILLGDARFLGDFFEQSLTVLAHRQDPLIVNHDELAVVFRVLLHLGSVLGPIEVGGHPL